MTYQYSLPLGFDVDPRHQRIWILAPQEDELSSVKDTITNNKSVFLIDGENGSVAVNPNDIVLLASSHEMLLFAPRSNIYSPDTILSLKTSISKAINGTEYTASPRTILQLSMAGNGLPINKKKISRYENLSFYLGRIRCLEATQQPELRDSLSELLLSHFEDSMALALAALLFRIRAQAKEAIALSTSCNTDQIMQEATGAYKKASQLLKLLKLRHQHQSIDRHIEELEQTFNLAQRYQQPLLPGLELPDQPEFVSPPAFSLKEFPSALLTPKSSKVSLSHNQKLDFVYLGKVQLNRRKLATTLSTTTWNQTDVRVEARNRKSGENTLQVLIGEDFPTRLCLLNHKQNQKNPPVMVKLSGPNGYSSPYYRTVHGEPIEVSLSSLEFKALARRRVCISVFDTDGYVQQFQRRVAHMRDY
ncbi:MAG: hypothetical protein RIG26_06135 [Thalassospira sp.]|uniref:hypothetical protein n=1 Tax=Thalassospira sp. TaxID=1912094 RepID=UPI0032EB5433